MQKLNLGLIFLLSHCVVSAEVPSVRILLGNKVSNASVSGIDLKRVISGTNRTKLYNGFKKIKLKCDVLRKYSHVKKSIPLATYSSATNFINLNNKKYLGSLSLVMVAKGRGCNIVNTVPLEDYIKVVLPKEMSSKWPIEALKAQAIAARSYAYYKMQTGQVSKDMGHDVFYDLENSEKHQVNGNIFDITDKVQKAQRATNGQILFNQSGKNIPIFFHSKCGGRTKIPSQIWKNKIEGYSSIKCPYCHSHGMKDWKHTMTARGFHETVDKVLSNYYNQNLSNPQGVLKVLPDAEKHSKIRFYENDKLRFIQKSRVSNIVGRKSIPSSNFTLIQQGPTLVVKGKGFGHGVGLCQYGAYEMAKQGYSYHEILKFYFPKLNIKKIY